MSLSTNLAEQTRDKIIVIGGYGQVGRSIAKQLAPCFPNRLVIAGRDLSKATNCAADIGYGVVGRTVDVFSKHPDRVLADVALVVMCLDQKDIDFVRRCLSNGIHYVDITAGYEFQKRLSTLDGLAKQRHATAVLSVGVAPGLTNLLAAHAAAAMDSIDRIDIFVQLGLGDRHGAAAIGWMLDNLDASYDVREGGRPLTVHSFGEVRLFRLPCQPTTHKAYRFNFSDQNVLAGPLNLPSISTWLCFDNWCFTWLLSVCARAGFGRMMRMPRLRAAATWLIQNVHFGSNICAVAVRATGKIGDHGCMVEYSIAGHNEVLMTAVVVAESVRQVLLAKPDSGVFHSDQVIAFDLVLLVLSEEFPDLAITSSSNGHGDLVSGLPTFAGAEPIAKRTPVAWERSRKQNSHSRQYENCPKQIVVKRETARRVEQV